MERGEEAFNVDNLNRTPKVNVEFIEMRIVNFINRFNLVNKY